MRLLLYVGGVMLSNRRDHTGFNLFLLSGTVYIIVVHRGSLYFLTNVTFELHRTPLHTSSLILQKTTHLYNVLIFLYLNC